MAHKITAQEFLVNIEMLFAWYKQPKDAKRGTIDPNSALYRSVMHSVTRFNKSQKGKL